MFLKEILIERLRQLKERQHTVSYFIMVEMNNAPYDDIYLTLIKKDIQETEVALKAIQDLHDSWKPFY